MSECPTQTMRLRGSKVLLQLLKLMIVLVLLRSVIRAVVMVTLSTMRNYNSYTIQVWKSHLHCTTKDLELLRNHNILSYPKALSEESKCPKSTWLEEMYEVKAIQNKGRSNADLLGISIGCNTGMDAIGTSRMMSQNPLFSKQQWLSAMENVTQKSLMAVCRSKISRRKGHHADLDEITIDTKTSMKQIEFHCIEPMASTFHALNTSNLKLGLNQHGFHVHRYVMSDTPGSAYFPIGGAGVENMSAFMCLTPTQTSNSVTSPANTAINTTTTTTIMPTINCERLERRTLDDFMAKVVDKRDDSNNHCRSVFAKSRFCLLLCWY
jgi:hypothetical protein